MSIPISAQGFFWLKWERERRWQPNVQIWERQIKDGELSNLGIFSSSNKELFFFSNSLSGRVVFYAIDKFHNLFIFNLSLTWRLFGCWCNIHRGQFGQIKLTQHRVHNSYIILPINDCFSYFINLGFEYHIFYK